MSLEIKEEIQSAEILRSLTVTADSWENDNLSILDMTDQLDAIIAVVDGTSNFNEFAESTNLAGRERLN